MIARPRPTRRPWVISEPRDDRLDVRAGQVEIAIRAIVEQAYELVTCRHRRQRAEHFTCEANRTLGALAHDVASMPMRTAVSRRPLPRPARQARHAALRR